MSVPHEMFLAPLQAPSPSRCCQEKSCLEMSTTSTKTCPSGNLTSAVSPLFLYNLCLFAHEVFSLQDSGWLPYISVVENV